MRLCIVLLLSMCLTATPAFANAAEPSVACENAAIQAEKKYSIPGNLLQAIALVESGHTRNGLYAAWPWTVNENGHGLYFRTKNEAARFIRNHVQFHNLSVDVGCFQINFKWHGKAFSSAEAILDPTTSAAYAAKFLSELYYEFGDWNVAVAKYHSRNKNRGEQYRAKITTAIQWIEKPLSAESNIDGTPQSAEQLLPAGSIPLSVFLAASPLVQSQSTKTLIFSRD